MDTFDLLLDLWKLVLNWIRTEEIVIGRHSFTYLEFWLFCIVLSLVVSFIIHIFNS